MGASESDRRNLVLIGGRGSGKSSIARRIARREDGFVRLSLDDLIRYEAGGRSIPDIVAVDGWGAFRELEYRVVRKAAGFGGDALIDCGGGVVVDLDDDGAEVFSARKVETLRASGFVVYLQREVAYLVDRIAGDPSRPPLSDVDSFTAIMARRDPWYRRAAHCVLECGPRTERELTDAVLDAYRTG